MGRAQSNTDVFYAIADPTRRAIVDALGSGEQAASMLAGRFDCTFSAISQHMRILRDVGLVSVRSAGRERIYRLEAQSLAPVSDWVGRYDSFWQDKLAALGELLEDENE